MNQRAASVALGSGLKKMENEIRNKIERWTIKAEAFLKNNTKAFIVDINNTYYFCDILFVGEDGVYVYNFKGQRAGEKENIFWADVERLDEYREKIE